MSRTGPRCTAPRAQTAMSLPKSERGAIERNQNPAVTRPKSVLVRSKLDNRGGWGDGSEGAAHRNGAGRRAGLRSCDVGSGAAWCRGGSRFPGSVRSREPGRLGTRTCPTYEGSSSRGESTTGRNRCLGFGKELPWGRSLSLGSGLVVVVAAPAPVVVLGLRSVSPWSRARRSPFSTFRTPEGPKHGGIHRGGVS